jgi:hypothetical protein
MKKAQNPSLQCAMQSLDGIGSQVVRDGDPAVPIDVDHAQRIELAVAVADEKSAAQAAVWLQSSP